MTSPADSELAARARASIMMMTSGTLAEFRDIYHPDAVNREARAELVAIGVRMSGRHTGTMVTYRNDGSVDRAFAPTGKRFESPQAHFLRVRNDMVVEHWAIRDDLGQARQLGWIPPSPAYLLRCALATASARRGLKAGKGPSRLPSTRLSRLGLRASGPASST